MATLSGLQSGFFTDIDVVDVITINGDAGTANQVLTSDGTNTSYQDPTLPAVSSLLTAGTGIDITNTGNPETISTNVKSLVLDGTAVSGAPQTFNPNANGGSQTITINDTDNQLTLVEQNGIVITDLGGFNRGIATDIDADTIVFNGTEMEVAKVPNSITFATDGTGSSTGTFDGSSAITIDNRNTDTQLNLTEGNGITITNTGGVNRTIAVNADGTTLSNNVGSGQAGVLKVPNSLSAGTNLDYSSGTTFDGSSARTINLETDLTGIDSITFTNGSGTTLTGSSSANNPTTMTNFDLTDTSNIVSPYFFHDVYDPASLDTDSLTTSYANIFSSNLFNSFTAKQTAVAIELRVYNAQFSTSGRTTYARLNGSSSTLSSAEFTTFYSTSGRSTTRVIHQADESDDVNLTMTWYLTGLTIGNSYNLYPQMRSSTTTNSIYAGGSYPPCILRGYYLPSTGI